MEMAYWDAQMMGLDPQELAPLTFNIGTGSIEKVSRIRDKYNLTESYTYQDGFEDGVKFAREVIINNIRLWAETSDDGSVYDDIADRLEFGTVDYDL
jgi:hypothetical protein